MDSNLWRIRSVIVHRDGNGYGLTVSGDNPVSIQTIRPGGAAEVAGIREGDIIVKVNGTLVEHMNHPEVVNLIKTAGPYVTLTVRPPDTMGIPAVGLISGNGGRPHHVPSSHERTVTAPLPVDRGVQLQMQDNKLRTLQVYRDQAAAEFEAAWRKFESSQNPRDRKEFEKAEKSLRGIEAQMKKFRQSSPNLQLHSPAPFNPYPQSHQPVQFLPYAAQQSHQNYYSGNGGQQRNRNPLSSQTSVPSFSNQMPWDYGDSPPPLPPRSFSQSSSFTANSNEQSSYPLPPGYSPHDPFVGPGGNLVNLSSNSHLPYQPSNNNVVSSNKSPDPGSAAQSHNSQQHHRAKSSPDPVSMQKALNSEASKRSDSVSDLTNKTGNPSPSRTSLDWDSLDSTRSPPGSPPPPYGRPAETEGIVFNEENSLLNDETKEMKSSKRKYKKRPKNLLSSNVFGSVRGPDGATSSFLPGDIMSMEEEDCQLSRDALGLSNASGKHGPWNSLSKLLLHNAHLAVFMNYVIDNRCDPSSLLFYLITGLYIDEGTLKEMKRWGYEIHSTFTAPGSPLLVPHVDENISAEIDDSLVRESDKEEMMRRVFRKARNKAKEEINKQLEEFCNKRTAGLGSMFGPPDSQLEECIVDKTKEIRILETYLVPRLESYWEEYEKNSDDRTLAIVNAISTLLQKQFLLRSPGANSVLERCASFVSKEKSARSKFMSKHKKISYNGHHFTPQIIYSYTECNICCKILWGVGPQGLQCSDCNVNIHRNCLAHIQDNCLGSEPESQKKKDRLRQFKDKIRPRSDAQKRRSSGNPMKRPSEDGGSIHSPGSLDIELGDKPLSSSGSSSSNLKNNDRRPDTLSEERLANDGLTYENDDKERANQEPRRASNAVGRSESCKERVQRKQPRERRKHSDPNLTSKSSDVDLENRNLDSNNSSSSSSSLSARSLDSPSTSLELVAPAGHSASSLPGRNSETPETTVGHFGLDPYKPSQSWEDDSDIEVEHDAPDWTKDVPEETLSQLEPREKKRQEVLNELFHTERSHVRNLKVVDRLFHRPIRHQQLLPPDLVQMLFASWEELLDIHVQFNNILKKKRKETPVIGDIGPLLLEIFDGDKAESFKRAAASCCAKQQIGLRFLKEKREKSPKLNAFLQEAEQDPVCRRLQVQDMIPMAMQRLTKYPLMFEKLCYHSSPDTQEHQSTKKALEMSKEILNSVNHAKKEAEDHQRLEEIQRKLDKSSLEKGILSLEKGVDKLDVNFVNELRNLDVTTHKLIYEGHLYWRLKSSKQKSEVQQEVQLVLLHDMVVILLKQDDRFVLKIHSSSSYPGKAERVISRPVIKLNNLIHRANAADKKAFMLINMTSTNMYDLVCSSMEERKVWLHHITKAAEDYKSRQESRRSDFHPTASIPSIPEPVENNKEPVESGESSEAHSETPSQKDTSSQLSDTPIDASNDNSDLNKSAGTEALGVGNGSTQSRSVSASPNPTRKVGEFLRVTESSPLIDPSEVLVTTRDIQFAQPVISPYEELKRVDSSITKGFEDKMKLVSQILHIPPTKDPALTNEDGKGESTLPAGDAKELIVACMQQVDQLGRILAEQKITNENMPAVQEQSSIQRSLNILLTQLLGEVNRKEEELEMRRQELHRVREQNHGYQERLQSKAKTERLAPSPVKGGQKVLTSSPNLSPSHSRPNSFVSLSPSSEPHEDEEVVMMKTHSKLQSCDPVATSSCNFKDPVAQPLEPFEYVLPAQFSNDGQVSDSACDLAPEEFADAVEELTDQNSLEKDAEVETEDLIPMQSQILATVPEKFENAEENRANMNSGSKKNEAPLKENFRVQNGKGAQDENRNKD